MEEGPKQKEQHQSRGRIRQRPRQKVPNSTSDGAGSLVADGSMVTRLETSSDDALPPPYGEQHMKFSQPGIDAGAEATGKTSLRRDPRVERFKTVDLKVQTRDDGRININICTKDPRLEDLLAPKIDSRTLASPALPPAAAYIPPGLGAALGQPPLPVLNVVIQIVGSRGDVQPFLALGKVLKETYGHRIRIATHATFKSFVEENGLEFFNIGGDPAELMAFMVKNPGLMPGINALKSGEITRRRRGIENMLLGCWRSCFEAGDGMGPPPKQHRVNAPLDFSQILQGHEGAQPFVADAIIANPPSFAHIHIAEKMGIPLHMMFTSPALIPKPNDWPVHIDISGFCFLDLASSYIPDPDLAEFLEAGPPPVYIGFGSIVVDDPNSMTQMIFEAIRLAGIRALVSKGWGGLGAEDGGNPENIFMLGNVPHDWLFERVSAVVHHGGAGTTATGIKAGKPTLIVPFFGDQPFWGAMIAKANAGPEPILYKDLTAEKLAEAIKICLEPNTLARAAELGTKIREEAGTDVGARSFHRPMDIENMRCSLVPSRAAAWRVRRTKVRLSPLALSILVDAGLLEYKDVKLCRHVEYNTEDQHCDPVSAVVIAIIGDLSDIGLAIADVPRNVATIDTLAAGQSMGRAVSTGFKVPMNFALGVAKGFRNMPRLYNDDTVRPTGKVTDLTSGIRLAGKELGLGFFDGITGLVTQPIRGAGKDGASGFVKGIGKGIGELIAKPAAGVYGIPAYMMQGVHAEVSKMFLKSFTNYVITSRIVQGDQDRAGAGEEERAEIIIRWNNIKPDLKRFHVLKRSERKKAQKAQKAKMAAVPSHTLEMPSSQVAWKLANDHWSHGQDLPSEGKQKLVAHERDSFSSVIATAASNESDVMPSLGPSIKRRGL
ncbi:hypothetical protein E4U56_003552 [Claviceps arundinis]|uniref:Glycosyltransferase family 28 N-terminal domain-containing protein n=1 Tax=Claviceps arundinis TaxID=1623583 RepID=A0A9P7MPM5_9HYPO|nr:hypothetical protein E4U56_003552 [Claviceps arundinis]